ncbi:MAG: hypothetical protein GWN99_12380 [Gemmatimonadetes bacterium]|uniref:YbbR-like protein n=1 Tax=Candidatus Kutchimonas denitrificans TaxID=3056748 RepID=A0AAE5CB93_9BACT|nr:hypothetical protein [Gemmatimonadota bacterium]NIR75527.1 hypothetical protein [Candidatus Kutchimonas denitrificans]NIS01841.1 hypothetical protein [Gemmatimonadota bacterium]NIT67622.1 hypothetical protein [Gemmatimonadota bacterium]NIU53496.1 hypothetical protein [Gemmatimonadota bacterium]
MSDVRTTLKQNWPYMTTALLISVFLWIAVSADTVEQRAIDTDVVFILDDPRYVLTETEPATDLASVVFTGKAGDLAALAASRPQIVVPIDTVEGPVREITLEPEMVRSRGGFELLDVRPVSVRPDDFVLHFQPRARKVVQVVPRVHVTLAEGYVISDSVRAEPGAVAVEGPESAVEAIDSVITVPVVRERLRETISVEVRLEVPGSSGQVELSSPSVRVTVPVEPRTERIFRGIPVGVSDASTPGLRAQPSLVDVRITGPRSAVESLRSEQLSPRVRLQGPQDLGRPLPIIMPPPAPFLTVEVDPDSVRVVRERGP